MAPGVTRAGDTASPRERRWGWLAVLELESWGSVHSLPLRVGAGTGVGAVFPLPALDTRPPSSSHPPGGQLMGHLWRMAQLYLHLEPLVYVQDARAHPRHAAFQGLFLFYNLGESESQQLGGTWGRGTLQVNSGGQGWKEKL